MENLRLLDTKRFQKNLKNAILEQYETLEKFAFENGLEKTTIYRIVNGTVDPKLSTVVSILNALDIPIEDAFKAPG